ncbi:hypothetical protein [Legionella hackeliae]|uniref:Uncharacterized protein n=1 Tax=Legionella hackeliae TaxID=449 RepID=A0A0A8ULR3_LEGHA|nr:hypothetical protein [Legionella hackeliae]KTD10154.1 hypothetical protein Lhac_2522 [Legionella hackeliae]CEK09648.1 conserved protein of unknown function [Legionella hackeliae]STX49559.1 Uncharacterised protein [Legionella hackeliae]
MFTYTATVYFGSHGFSQKSGNNLDGLFIWMLNQGDQHFGAFSGQIINNLDKVIEKKFKKNAIH